MTDAPNNDDWLSEPAPASFRPEAKLGNRKSPARPIEVVPTEDELREALANAPEVPSKEGRDYEHGPGGRRDERNNGAHEGRDAGGGGSAGSSAAADRGDGAGHGAGAPPGADTRGHGEIWPDCPVTPLGVRGDYSYYLDVLGQLRAIKKHENNIIMSLFGHRIPALCHQFPVWEKIPDSDPPQMRKKKNRFEATSASMVMYQAVSECGVFNPDNAVRGVGCWTDDNGALIYHAGDQILFDGEWRRPGRIEGKIYPAYAPIPRPSAAEDIPDPVPEILKTLETWNWTAPDLHPHLALGMVATMALCGALEWRPVFWLLAPAGAGKSEFQKLLKYLLGEDGLVQTTDATKSGITSKLGQSSLPVSVDELEPGDERSTKERDLIALARVAASGGEWFRGSADQTGVGGKVYSAFLFSSVLIPGVMKTQDVQRLIRLQLRPLPKDAAKLNLDPRTWRTRGARLRALLYKRWDTWPERLSSWRHALELEGVTGRNADNWGTVLAMADMALQDDLPSSDVLGAWAHKVAFLAAADRDETTNDAEAMLLHLMGQPFDIYRRGEQFTIAQWMQVAASLPGAPNIWGDAGDLRDVSELKRRRDKANVALAKVGLRVQGVGDEAQLFIANKVIPGLNDLFRGSDWYGGVWKQSAERVPGATVVPHPLTLAGIRSRGYLLPLSAVPGLIDFPMDRDRDGLGVVSPGGALDGPEEYA